MSLPADSSLMTQGQLAVIQLPYDNLAASPNFTGYLFAGAITQPLGDLNPIYIPNPQKASSWTLVAMPRDVPDLPEAIFMERLKRNVRGVLETFVRQNCPTMFAMKASDCGRPDDIYNWQTLYVLVGLPNGIDYSDIRPMEGDEGITAEVTVNHFGLYRFLPMRLGEKADTTLLTTALDGIYADELSCGACAPYSDGLAMKFVLTDNQTGSPGLSSQIVYTKNGTTWGTDDINSLGGNSGSALTAMGQYLIVTEAAQGRHHYALKSSVTDSASTSQWTSASTGYVSANGGRAIVAAAANRAFIAGTGGYIYALSDPTSGVTVIHDGSLSTQSQNAIHATENLILSVGASNTILLSTNGASDFSQIAFSLITGPAVGVALTACWIRTATQFEVGTADGRLFYTVDGGTNWTQRLLPDQGTATYIYDLSYDIEQGIHGAVAVKYGATSKILRSVWRGAVWQGDGSITQVSPAPDTYRFCVVNTDRAIFAGGKIAGGTDGLIVEGVS
jgi:hypothetical protein